MDGYCISPVCRLGKSECSCSTNRPPKPRRCPPPPGRAKSTGITTLHSRYMHSNAPGAAVRSTREGDGDGDGDGSRWASVYRVSIRARICVGRLSRNSWRLARYGRYLYPGRAGKWKRKLPPHPPTTTDRNCRALRPSPSRFPMMLHYLIECVL